MLALGICIGFVGGVIFALVVVGLARCGCDASEEQISEFDRDLRASGLPMISAPMPAPRVSHLRLVS